MSHFTVLVIGPDPDGQLAPYHEFESTGMDDQYVQDIDQTSDLLDETQESVKQGGLDEKEALLAVLSDRGFDEDGLVEDESQVDPSNGRHKYRYAIVKDGKLVKAVKRTNPNAKWDWYSLGGRWTGFFRLKPEHAAAAVVGKPGVFGGIPEPGHADQALKGQIDFEWMIKEAAQRADKLWDAANNILKNDRYAFVSWEDVRSQYAPDYSAARRIYWGQSGLERLSKKLRELGFVADPSDLDKFLMERDDYVREEANESIATYAVIKDGVWYEKGSMGWFGMGLNEKADDEWHGEYTTLIADLPDDTLLSVYDCHI